MCVYLFLKGIFMYMIILCLVCILFFIWIAMDVWWIHPYKALNWFCHDILGWHKPDHTYSFDGVSDHSHCRFCGEEIMQDSQGNWFTFD